MIDLTKSIDNKFKSKIVLTVTLIFIYILLFQFILPVNKVLPKPSLLIESFIIIWSDYNLLTSLAVTSTVIYSYSWIQKQSVHRKIVMKISFICDFIFMVCQLNFCKYISSFSQIIIFMNE